MPGTLYYCKGDATAPIRVPQRHVVIPHVCNSVGGWGAGFTGFLSRLWPGPEAEYRRAAREGTLDLGLVQFVGVDYVGVGRTYPMTVANMIAQKGINGHVLPGLSRRPQLRYGSLVLCMRKVAEYAHRKDGEIHCPWFGTALAGGDAKTIDHLMWELWVEREGLDVFVYEFEPDVGRRGIVSVEKGLAEVAS